MDTDTSTMDFNTRLRRKAQSVNYSLQRILGSQDINSELKEALIYTLGTPGKRIRSVMLLWCCELVSGRAGSDAEIASRFLKAQLYLIRDYPGEYFSKIPDSLLSYYRQYSAYWASGNIKKFLNHDNLMNEIFLVFFNWHKQLFLHPAGLIFLLIAAPAVVLISTFSRKRRFHGWLLLLAVIHYNGFVSVFSTHAGINNLRCQIPVESLILLFFYAAFFYLGKHFAGYLSKNKKQRDISTIKSQNLENST